MDPTEIYGDDLSRFYFCEGIDSMPYKRNSDENHAAEAADFVPSVALEA